MINWIYHILDYPDKNSKQYELFLVVVSVIVSVLTLNLHFITGMYYRYIQQQKFGLSNFLIIYLNRLKGSLRTVCLKWYGPYRTGHVHTAK